MLGVLAARVRVLGAGFSFSKYYLKIPKCFCNFEIIPEN